MKYPSNFFDLCYHSTNTKIKLGDHVIYTTWFGLKKTNSRVCYIPGVSDQHEEMDDTDLSSLWAITYGSNDIVQMLYVVDDKFVSKRIKFVSRVKDNYEGLKPRDPVL